MATTTSAAVPPLLENILRAAQSAVFPPVPVPLSLLFVHSSLPWTLTSTLDPGAGPLLTVTETFILTSRTCIFCYPTRDADLPSGIHGDSCHPPALPLMCRL